MRHEVLHGLRVIGRTPALSAVTILTLALGIGANTAIFGIVNAALLRPLPYPEPERIVVVGREFPGESWPTVSIPKFVYWTEHNQAFTSLAAFEYLPSGYTMTGEAEPERIRGLRVTAGFFSVLGVTPALGRDFVAAEDEPGGSPVVVLGDGLWKRRFGGDPAVIGRDVVLNDRATTIVGVMPPSFSFPDGVELWTPYQLDTGSRDKNKARQAIGRIRSGMSLDEARAAMTLLGRQHRAVDPELVDEGERLTLTPLREHLHGSLRPSLMMLLAAVGFVLLVACVNVANLQLARSATRRRELALRTALGATGARLARQLLIECALLALAGGGAGLALGWMALAPVMALGPDSIRALPEPALDTAVIAFTLGLSVATGVLFGLLPALHARGLGLSSALHESSGRTVGGPAGARARRALVIAEVALTLMLLVAASLLTGSFRSLRAIDPGFRPSDAFTVRLPLPAGRYGSPDALDRLNRRLIEDIESVPGVESVGVASTLPFDTPIDLPFTIEGRFRDADSQDGVGDGQYRAVGGRFFEALGIPLRGGRTFTTADGPGAVGVAIINETAARRYWPDRDPIGARITPGMPHVPELADPLPRTIVGIVGDVRELSLDAEPPAIVYVPLGQIPPAMASLLVGSLPETVVVRTGATGGAITRDVRAAIRAVDPTLPITDLRELDAIVTRSLGSARFNTLIIGSLSVVALMLAAVGIYGVLSHLVTQRRREIGVRMALGASRRQVVSLVVQQAMSTVLVGAALGLGGALVVTRWLSGLLHGVSPTDPVSFALATGTLLAVAAVAALAPARRASGLDPLEALRSG